jgi:hypothetical protein
MEGHGYGVCVRARREAADPTPSSLGGIPLLLAEGSNASAHIGAKGDCAKRRPLPISVTAPIVNAHAALHNRCRTVLLSRFCAARSKVARLRRRNQITSTRTGFSARNVTLRRLIAEAWNVQLNQVLGPSWIDHSEYDIIVRTAEGTTKEQMAPMIKNLLGTPFLFGTYPRLWRESLVAWRSGHHYGTGHEGF